MIDFNVLPLSYSPSKYTLGIFEGFDVSIQIEHRDSFPTD